MSAMKVEIEGTITREGVTTKFRIDPEYGYFQWGGSIPELGANVDLPSAVLAVVVEELKPAYYECGTCGHFHKIGYGGDCRNDAESFDMTQLNAEHGEWPKYWDYVDEAEHSGVGYPK